MRYRQIAATVAAACATAGLLVAPAYATPVPTPTPTVTASPTPTVTVSPTLPVPVRPSVAVNVRLCGRVALAVSSPSRLVRVEYRIDRGEPVALRQFGPPTVLRFAEDSDVHTVQWRLVIGARVGDWSRPALVQSNCRAGVTEFVECGSARLVVHAAAARPARLWFREGDGEPGWRHVPAGQARTVTFGVYEEDSGDHVIRYRLWDGRRPGRVKTVTVKSDCQAPEPTPTPTPTVTETPAPDPEPTPEPSPTITGPQGPPGEDGQDGRDGADGEDGRIIVINRIPVPVRVDTGLGGTA